MGNINMTGRYYHHDHTPSPSPPPTHYTVNCGTHTWINVYDGYDWSLYFSYSQNTSSYCSECAKEANEREKKLARERAERTKRDEEKRVRELKEKLEREEREKQEKIKKENEEKRKKEQKRIIEERQKKEEQRIKLQKTLIRESTEKIEAEINRLESIKATNPYTAWKKCDTLNMVKEIGNRALEYSIAGQIICERIPQIKDELQTSLKDDYSIVAAEINRYQKYGEEMKSMTKEFVDAFGDVFDEFKNTKQEFGIYADDLKEAEDKDDEDYLKDALKENVADLAKAINKMKFKLLLMQQYYSRMKQDYEFFIEFIDGKDGKLQEYQQHKAGINSYLTGIANDLKSKNDRDVFEGTNEIQQQFIEEKYDIIKSSVVEKDVVIGKKRVQINGSGGNNFAQGAEIGAMAGGLGGTALGPGGAVVGAVCGCVIGACIDAFSRNKAKFKTLNVIGKEKRMINITEKNAGSIKLAVNKTVYNGLDHCKAIREIRDAMSGPIDKLIGDLEKEKQNVQDKIHHFDVLQTQTGEMLKTVEQFSKNVKDLAAMINSPKGIKESDRRQLDKKWTKTAGEISGLLQMMKQTNN